jgi:hypothetical protein
MSPRPANGDSELARSRQTPFLARDFSGDPYWCRLAPPRLNQLGVTPPGLSCEETPQTEHRLSSSDTAIAQS